MSFSQGGRHQQFLCFPAIYMDHDWLARADEFQHFLFKGFVENKTLLNSAHWHCLKRSCQIIMWDSYPVKPFPFLSTLSERVPYGITSRGWIRIYRVRVHVRIVRSFLFLTYFLDVCFTFLTSVHILSDFNIYFSELSVPYLPKQRIRFDWRFDLLQYLVGKKDSLPGERTLYP